MYSLMYKMPNISDWRQHVNRSGSKQWLPRYYVTNQNIFRWHDSGDIQSLKHLAKIFKVARLTPDVNHWLPTREAWVKPYVGRAPKNLVIRFSMPMVDQPAAESWSHTSTVVSYWSARVQLLIKTMLAASVERAGILTLKMLHTVNTSAALIPGRAIAETRFQPQAASFKRQAPSYKRNKPSYKRLNFS
jgi:hypothetical protein